MRMDETAWRHTEAGMCPGPREQPARQYIIRGGDLQDKSQLFDGSQVNSNVTPIYKDREKRIFEFGVRLDPPH